MVGENESKGTAGLERLPRICQELWVLVFSSVSYCPHAWVDSGELLEMGQEFPAQRVHHEELGCSGLLRQWKLTGGGNKVQGRSAEDKKALRSSSLTRRGVCLQKSIFSLKEGERRKRPSCCFGFVFSFPFTVYTGYS